MGPILAAPIAHLCVTLHRDLKTEAIALGVGIVGSTVATVGMRVWSKSHAGYPGSHNSRVNQREKLVSLEEKRATENLSFATIGK
jgi:hypothetical protein